MPLFRNVGNNLGAVRRRDLHHLAEGVEADGVDRPVGADEPGLRCVELPPVVSKPPVHAHVPDIDVQRFADVLQEAPAEIARYGRRHLDPCATAVGRDVHDEVPSRPERPVHGFDHGLVPPGQSVEDGIVVDVGETVVQIDDSCGGLGAELGNQPGRHMAVHVLEHRRAAAHRHRSGWGHQPGRGLVHTPPSVVDEPDERVGHTPDRGAGTNLEACSVHCRSHPCPYRPTGTEHRIYLQPDLVGELCDKEPGFLDLGVHAVTLPVRFRTRHAVCCRRVRRRAAVHGASRRRGGQEGPIGPTGDRSNVLLLPWCLRQKSS